MHSPHSGTARPRFCPTAWCTARSSEEGLRTWPKQRETRGGGRGITYLCTPMHTTCDAPPRVDPGYNSNSSCPAVSTIFPETFRCGTTPPPKAQRCHGTARQAQQRSARQAQQRSVRRISRSMFTLFRAWRKEPGRGFRGRRSTGRAQRQKNLSHDYCCGHVK